jgi:hypothetical protein
MIVTSNYIDYKFDFDVFLVATKHNLLVNLSAKPGRTDQESTVTNEFLSNQFFNSLFQLSVKKAEKK